MRTTVWIYVVVGMLTAVHVAGSEGCSTSASSAIRSILKSTLYQTLNEKNISLSESCPLHPSRDRFREWEDHKHMVSRTQWQCQYCHKLFKSESFLDLHMTRKHMDRVPSGANVCLADHCAIFGTCDNTTSPHPAITHGLCRPSAMARVQYQCQALFHTCFPTDLGPNAQAIHDHFVDYFCNKLTCETLPVQIESTPLSTSHLSAGTILTVLFAVFLLIFYIAYYCHRR